MVDPVYTVEMIVCDDCDTVAKGIVINDGVGCCRACGGSSFTQRMRAGDDVRDVAVRFAVRDGQVAIEIKPDSI